MLPSYFRTAATGALLCLFAASLSAIWPQSAQAQLSSAQQSALKSNCRGDFFAKCSGVTPGGKDALTCLQKNVASLSAGCQTAVKATLPPPPAAAAPAPTAPPPKAVSAPPPPKAASAPPPAAPAAPPPPKAATAPAPQATPSAQQQAAIKQYCRSDFMSNCPGVSPGPGALQCLQRNAAKLSPNCRTAIGASAPAPKAATAPKAAAPKVAAPAAAPAQPNAQQQAAIKQYCRSDFMSKCPGVSPGPGALQCLQRNAATLSPNCKSAVASLGGAPATAAAPAAAGVAAQPTPEQISALKFSCRGDVRSLCRGVPQGPEIFGCLSGNAARLTPNCKTAVADIAQSMPDGAVPAAAPAAAAAAPAAEPARGGPLRRAIRRRLAE